MKSNEQKLSDAIGDFLKVSSLGTKLSEHKLVAAWEKVMGKIIAKHTREIRIYKKKLYLQIDSAPLKQELFYSRDKLLKRLNEEAGTEVIEEIVIR